MDATGVYQVLERCVFAAANADKLAAVRQLELMDAAPAEGYVSCLVQIIQASSQANNAGARQECRQLAALSLKNIVSKCWTQRSDQTRMISIAEKTGLKAFALSYSLEPDRKVAVQLAVVTATMAVKDWYSGQWPQLFPALFEAISQPCAQSAELTWMQHARAMSTLVSVLEELGHRKLPGQQRALAEVCAACFPHLAGLWQTILAQVLPFLQQQLQSSGQAGRDRQKELLCSHLAVTTRALAKVIHVGFKDLTKAGVSGASADTVAQLFETIVAQVPTMRLFLRNAKSVLATASSGGDEDDNDGCLDEEDDEDGDSGYENDSVSDGGVGSSIRSLIPSVRRVIRDLARIPVALQREYPLQMAPYVEPFLHFFHAQLVDEYGGSGGPATTLQALSVSAVLFMSCSLQCSEYSEAGASSAGSDALRNKETLKARLGDLLVGKTPAGNDEDVAAAATQAASQGYAARHSFFTSERCAGMLELMLFRLLRYTPSELEEWESSPEQFSTGQEELLEKDSVRCASEGLVVAMLDETVCPCSAEIATRLVAHLQNVPSLIEAVQPGAAEDSIFLWDAIFLCTGLGNYALGHRINADEWLSSVLGPLLPALFAAPGCGALRGGQQLLRSRLLWLIRAWLYHFNPQIYGQLVSFLVTTLDKNSGSDIVVRIEATKVIEQVILQPTFQSDLLLPVIVPIFEALCALTLGMDESELQAPVVRLMGSLVDTMGVKLRLLLEPLAQHMLSLWQASETNSPVRSCILDALTKMVRTSGKASASLHGLAIPLIANACSGEDVTAHLSADGVALCLAVMRNLPSSDAYCDAIDSLLGLCVRCLFSQIGSDDYESGSHLRNRSPDDDLRNVMLICEAYAITDGPRMLFANAAVLREALLRLLGQTRANLVEYIARPIEALFLSCPADAGRFLLESGVLHATLRPCLASVPQFAHIESLAKHHDEDVVLVSYLSIFARLLLTDIAQVMPAAQSLCAECLAEDTNGALAGLNDGLLVKCLVRLMIDKFDAVGNCVAGMWRRRLWVLSLLSLYPHTTLVHEWFPEVVNMAIDVLTEEASELGMQKRDRLLQAMMGQRRDEDDYDDDAAEEGEEGIGRNKNSDPEPIVEAFNRMFTADIVMATNIEAVLSDKAQVMKA